MSKSALHYYVVGVNGGGKTSLLKMVGAQTGIPVVHGTTELMKYLGIPGDYDALRAMDQGVTLEKWNETVGWLLKAYEDRPLLLDTHLMNLTNGKVIPRTGPWIGKFDALILIKAEPAAILARINNDHARHRAMFPAGLSEAEKLAMLTHYQQETEKLFNALAAQYKLPATVIVNADGKMETAAQELIAFCSNDD